jgi:hypothetical protein
VSLPQLQAWLLDAQTKYHQLMTGALAVELAVDGNTFVTRFARPDADKLYAYIARLQDAITTYGRLDRKGAIAVLFN